MRRIPRKQQSIRERQSQYNHKSKQKRCNTGRNGHQIAELFNESRQNSKIRDAELALPTSKIPDLGWQFDEDIQLVEPAAEQIYSLEPIQEKAQNPIAPPIEEEMAPVQPVEETATETVPTEAVEIQAVETQKLKNAR